MAGFGGAVKLTGESEYRRALNQITNQLREVTSAMNVVSATYSQNDRSIEALTARENALNDKLLVQNNRLAVLSAQYEKMRAKSDEQTQKHKALVDAYEREVKTLDDVGRTLGETSKEYQEQKAKVEELAKEVSKSTQAQDANEKSMSNMRVQILNAQADAKKTEKAIDDLGNATDEAGEDARKAGEGYSIFNNIVANLATSAIQTALSGLKRLGGAVVDIGKQAYGLYAQNEQLVGGVETLFGESADKLIGYANEAYKTAGVSANQYMEQATSFSATLLQGLGGDTERAVEYANLAIIDMSDNANKMGTDMIAIQNAYQGFAKDNYTMLDNLKLGYGGTAGEMARLINDTKVLGEGVEITAKEVKDVPFNKIIEAIHKTQVEIGITGTTALEGATTIEGSTKSVRASWENLLVGIASGNSDLGGLLHGFIDNVLTMARNAVPRIVQIVKGMWTAVKTILREFAPEIAYTIIPVIENVIKVLKTVVTYIAQNFKTLVPIIIGVVGAFTMLNAVMSANPITIMVKGIQVFAVALVALMASMDNVDKSVKETRNTLETQRETLERNTESWESLKEAQENTVNAGMSELAYYDNLADELAEITDENGKVKEGYEARASFITSQLSDALGVEIQMQDGVIQNYQSLRDEINKTMELKKAQIVLESQETLYKEAISKQTDALYALNEAQAIYNAEAEEMIPLQEELAEKKAQYERLLDDERNGLVTLDDARKRSAELEISNIQQEIDARQSNYDLAKENYDNQLSLYEEYVYNIGQYEKNLELMHAERYDEMTNVSYEYTKKYSESIDAQKAMLEEQVKATETNLDILKRLQEESGDTIYDEQIRSAERLLEQQKGQLAQYQSATEEGLNDVSDTWMKTQGTLLTKLTGKQVEFRDTGMGTVQMYVNGVASGKETANSTALDLAKGMVGQLLSQSVQAEIAGIDFVNGVNRGVNSQGAQHAVFESVRGFGASMLRTMRASLQEASPSKATAEMGAYLVEGLEIGMANRERQALRQAGVLGKDVLRTINGELSTGVRVSASAQTSTGQSIVSAFKQALEDVQIVLDEDVAGRFIDKTVTNLIYT